MSAENSSEPQRALFYFAVLLLGSSIAVLRELVVRAPSAYLLAAPLRPATSIGVGLSAFLVCLVVGSRERKVSDRFDRLAQPLLALSAALVAVSGPSWFLAWGHTSALVACGLVLPAAGGAVVGLCLGWSAAWVLPLGQKLNLLDALLHPLRLAALVFGAGVWAYALDRVGIWRASAFVAWLVAILAFWLPRLYAYLEGRQLSGRRWSHVEATFSVLLGGSSLLAAEHFVPRTELDRVPGQVVHVARAANETFVVVAEYEGYQLFADGALRSSSLDGYRYAEALVHPAMTAAPRHGRVLVLGTGDGSLEREILRYSDVEQLTVVVPAVTSTQARGNWRLVQAERAPWVRALADGPRTQSTSFDVIIADLPDPSGYEAGKHFTLDFFQSLRTLLTTDGVLAMQTASGFSTPKTAATIERTLKETGLVTRSYRAAIPSIGEWSFLLASRSPTKESHPLPPKLRYLNGPTLAALFAVPPTPDAQPSRLFDQRAVQDFATEREWLAP